MAQAFRTQNLRLLGNLFDKNNSLGAKGYSLHSTGDGTAWQADLNEDSGILTGGVLSIGSGNTISVTAGTGQIYSRSVVSSEVVTTLTNVSWNAFTNVSLTYLATKQFTYLYIDQFGALIQSDTVFSDQVFKDYIVIGIVVHLNSSTVNAVINSQNAAYGDAHRLYELYNSFGPIKRSGLVISSNGANLKINRSSGSALLIGCNYTTDQFEPDIATITSYTDVKFARVRANGTGGFTFDSNSGSLYTAIDPNNYDNGTGTLASVTSGYWTIQRFYLFPKIDDRLVNYYGVATYPTLGDALTALPNESFSESPFTARDTVFLGYLIVKQGITDLSSASNAKFLQAGLSRSLSSSSVSGGGSAAGALDDLSDVQITTALGGQFLIYDSTTSLWKNRSFILDANNNELIKFPSSVASAVNELTISNAATSGSPSISATGDDTNIGLNLIPKGTGLIQINGKAISLANSFTTSGNFALTFTTTGTTSLTLPTTGTLATLTDIPTVYNNTLTLAGSGGISLSTTPTFTANASADKTITLSIADGALTIAKLADIPTLRILGRTSASTGPVQELDGSGVVTVIGLNAVTRTENIEAGNAGQIPYQSGPNTTLFSAAGTANQVLLSGGTGAPTWANQSSLSVGSATTAGSLANALTISSPLTGTSYNGSSAVSIGLQNASDVQAGGVSIGAQTFAGNKTFKDNVIVSGNLTVNGSTVTINSSTLSVDDKNIELGAVIAIASLSSTVNIDAGDANVIVSSTSGLIVGQALTKISGTGAFGANPVISSITSATQFTVSPVHATTGSIVFSVGGATDVTADGGGITLKGTTDKTIIWVDSTDAWTLSEHLNIANGKSYRINGTDVLSSTTLGSGVVNSSLTSVGTLANLTVTNTINGSVSGSAGSLSGTYTFWGQSFNGTQNVSGNLTSVGNITGSSGITITAGGSNQNIVLTPSGTGYTLLNGSVGIGNSTPNNKLTIQAGDNKDSGPIINLGGNAINQFESGRIRFTEVVTGATPFYQGAYLHYDGSNNLFHIGVHENADALIDSDTNAISIIRSSANVGVGTTSVLSKFVVNGGAVNTSTYTSSESRIADGSLHLMKTVAGGIFESIRAMNADTTAGTTVRFIAASTSDPFNNTNGGKVFIDAIRSATNMDLAFSLNDIAGAAPVERVRFMGSGNVGIGTTNAIYALDVYKDINAGHIQAIRNINSGSSAYAALFIGNDQGANKIVMFSNSSARTGDGGVGNSTIRTDSGNLYLGASASQHILSTTGNVGIGITSTPNNKLHIAGSASIGSGYNVAAPTNGLLVEGNVGIGISSPTTKLHIVGSHVSQNGMIRFEASDYPIISLKAPATGDGSAGYWGLRAQDTSNNDLMFYGYRYTSAFSGFWIDPDFGSNIAKGFFVKRSDGNVGIGNNIPLARLHVNSTVSGATLIRADGTNGTLFSVTDDLSDSLMSVNNSAGLPVLEVFADDRVVMGQYGQNDLVVRNNKVGVGTVNPIYQLDIPATAALSRIGSVLIGSWPVTNSLAMFANSALDQSSGANYAVLQSNNGITYINASTSQSIRFRIANTDKWIITSAGVLQSSGAQTIQTDTGNLTIATAAGNGHIVLSPHGTGNVGIGTNSPSSKLHISNSAAATRITITDDVANGRSGYIESNYSDALVIGTTSGVRSIKFAPDNSTAMTIAVGTNNVGIGTTSPSNKLHVNGGIVFGYGSDSAFYTGTEFDSSKYLILQNNTNEYGRVGLFINAKTFSAANTPSTNDGWSTDPRSGIRFRAWLSGDSDYATKFVIQHLLANATNAVGDLGIFATGFSSTIPAFVLTGGGSIGIGTTTPSSKLDINGTARVRSISASGSAATIFLTTDANGVLISRTAAQVRSDIGAGTGNGTVTSVTGSGGLASSGGTTPDISIATDGVTTAKILNSNVTFAKIQDVTGPVVIGRLTATSGSVSALSSTDGRSALGATTVGGNFFTLTNPSAITFPRINADNTVSALDAATFRTAIGAGTGSGTVTSVTGTAPITSSGGTTPAISLNDAGVTYAKIQNVSATARVLGRITAGSGIIEELTGANVATIIGSNAIENATNVTIATDDATNSSYYLYFGANITGNTPLKASTKIRYNPNTGAFSATTKSFRIPHPTKPEHDLVYGSLESPYHGIRLTGKGKTNGVRAEIILPDYVKLLIDENTVNVQITAYKCSKVFYVEDIIIQDNKIVIKYDKSWYEKAKDIEFFWDFTAERKDVPKLIVEEKL
jgi:hypothetical protein